MTIGIGDNGSDFSYFNEEKASKKRMNCLAVLTHANGEKEYFEGANIVTTVGNAWYALRAANAASNFTVGFMRLGTSASAVSNTDTDVFTSFTSCGKALDGTYPMVSDTDTDNTGGGSTIVSWRVTYATTDVSQTGINELVLGNSFGAPTSILNHALFAASFAKTANDTLKVFVNHQMLGV